MGTISTEVESRNASAQALGHEAADTDAPEVSVVMPCLNEAETLAACIRKAQQALNAGNISGEIIVADNGSTDGSATIAAEAGARVVQVKTKGYGSALKSGIAAARGKYIITSDTDGSHDLTQIPAFLDKLREGYDLVVGNRFAGGIEPGAMGPLHRYVGNPALSRIAKLLFHSPCGDILCGLRAFNKTAFARMDLRQTGFDFLSEIVVRAAHLGLKTTELPTTQLPSGRSRPAHLQTWRDGWRLLVVMLLYSPRWLFLYPGVLLVVFGLLVGSWLLPAPRTVKGITFDIHTLLYAATAVILGFQSITFAAFTKIYAIRQGLMPEDLRLRRVMRVATLELGLVVGGLMVATGLAVSVYAVGSWGAQHFGDLDPIKAMRVIIPAVFSLALGGQIMLSSFFLSVLLLGQAPEPGEAPAATLD
jgi:glycosyltransferase involved in cell wall biosynthesis